MVDTIIYTLVTKGGGIDGLDFTDKGGNVTHAFFTRGEAERHPNRPWCEIVPEVVDITAVAKRRLQSLDPVSYLCVTSYLKKDAS